MKHQVIKSSKRRTFLLKFIISVAVVVAIIVYENGFEYGLWIPTSLSGSNDSVLDISRFATSKSNAAEERIKRIERECIRHRTQYARGRLSLKKWEGVPISNRPRFFVSDKYKFVVCATAKCGSTQWRKLIMILENDINSYSASEHKENLFTLAWKKRLLWNPWNISTTRGLINAEQRVNDYFRIMTVREPLERLVSAYKDKLESLQGEMRGLSKYIHRKYGNGSSGVATFSDFVKFILDNKDSRKLNVHWKPYTDSCDPCLMNYDFVAKLETINDDFLYLAQKLGIERNRAFNDSLVKGLKEKWTNKYHQYYKLLDERQRKEIFQYYKHQYDYFGYPYPNFI